MPMLIFLTIYFLVMMVSTCHFTFFPPKKYPQFGTVRLLSGVALCLNISALVAFVPIASLFDGSLYWQVVRLMHLAIFGIVALIYLVLAGMLLRAKFPNLYLFFTTTLGCSFLAGFMVFVTWCYYEVLLWPLRP